MLEKVMHRTLDDGRWAMANPSFSMFMTLVHQFGQTKRAGGRRHLRRVRSTPKRQRRWRLHGGPTTAGTTGYWILELKSKASAPSEFNAPWKICKYSEKRDATQTQLFLSFFFGRESDAHAQSSQGNLKSGLKCWPCYLRITGWKLCKLGGLHTLVFKDLAEMRMETQDAAVWLLISIAFNSA